MRALERRNTHVDKPPFDMKKSIEDTIQEMIKAKEDDPNIFIPASFLENYNSKEMNNFVKTTVEYCTALHKLEQYHEKRLSSSVGAEKEDVKALASRMAQSYGRLVLQVFYQRKSSKDEQNFFETLIYYLAKVLQPIFERDQLKWLEDELNRLFRSTAFNISRRNHLEYERNKKFPNLKYQKKNQDSLVNSIALRNVILRENLRVSISESTEYKPCYVKLSAYSALNARSPMISMILPSPSDRVRAFEL